MTKTTILILALLLAAPLGAVAATSDIVIDGVTNVPVIKTDGTLIVRGDIVAPQGATVLLEASRIIIESTATIRAGAGAHGAPAVNLAGLARGDDGTRGGDIILNAPEVVLDGKLFPGQGGRGGDALGHVAIGGNGGASGAAVVNGAPVEIDGYSLPEGVVRTTCPATDTQPPALPLSGANGGNACAQGIPGVAGAAGADGRDDPKELDKGSWPDCINYDPTFTGNFDGEKGQNGFLGLLGGPASATGGAGGSTSAASSYAGNGGSATATGGQGGKGGQGGMGGTARLYGNGCAGGNGGNGGPGGAAVATGGAQGINLVNCPYNGAPGTATAAGGAGGAGGWGGGGGGGNWPYSNGASGASGASGAAGSHSAFPAPTIPCVSPSAPSAVAHWSILGCDAATVVVTAPTNGFNVAITGWRLFRGTSPWSFTNLGIVPYTSSPQAIGQSGLTPDTTYYWKVKAVTAFGESSFSGVTSATPHCLTALPGTSLVPALIDATTPPLLTATAGPSSATLTIVRPVTIAGTPVHYEIFRNSVSIGTTGYVNGTTTFVDSAAPVGLVTYVVRIITSVDQADSLPAAVIVPLLTPPQGGGTGKATQATTTKQGTPPTVVTCSSVPVRSAFVFAGETFRVDTTYAASTSMARTDDPKFCASMPSQSRVYSDVEDPAPECAAGDAYAFRDGVYSVFRSCTYGKDGLVTKVNYRVTLREIQASNAWAYTEDVRTTKSDGSSIDWHYDAVLSLAAQAPR